MHKLLAPAVGKKILFAGVLWPWDGVIYKILNLAYYQLPNLKVINLQLFILPTKKVTVKKLEGVDIDLFWLIIWFCVQ